MLKQLKATIPQEAKESMRISLTKKKKNIKKKHSISKRNK